jgi:Tol biopolymer transport system component
MRKLAFALLIPFLLASSCDVPGVTDTSPMIDVTGRTERGTIVVLRLLVVGSPVAGAAFSVPPDGHAFVLNEDSLFLIEPGPLTIDARGLLGGDSVHATRTITIAAAPTIVFDGLVAGNRDIYSVGLDGSALVRLTTDPGDDGMPTALGATVYFISSRTGTAELFTVPLAGGADAPLAASALAESQPAAAPSGSHLAYVGTDSFPHIYVAGLDGGAVARFAAADAGFSGALEASPTWSPAGDRIAYTTTRDGLAGIYSGAISGAAGSATQLVSGAHGYASVDPAWNPNGLSVAFASNRDGPTDLYLIVIASGTVTRLTTRGNVGQPAWLADGRLVFTEFVPGANGLRWLDPADTSVIHIIPTGPGSAEHASGVR